MQVFVTPALRAGRSKTGGDEMALARKIGANSDSPILLKVFFN